MNHVLVVPNKLRIKLNQAYADISTRNKWINIGVNSVDAMIERITNDLNNCYGLCITSTREECEDDIKERIESHGKGRSSIFTGYLENENGYLDALFFYIPPDPGNANDCVSMKIMPSIFGVYKGNLDRTKDHHIHCMPAFIISLCTTSRVNNASVKKQIICCETAGYYYHDIFQNEYHDVIGRTDTNGNIVTQINSLHELDELLGGTAANKWFEVDDNNKVLRILDTTITNSTNPTSDIYRLSLYLIPSLYMAVDAGYEIDTSNIDNLSGDVAETLRIFISKL